MADEPRFQSHKTATGRKRFKRYFTGHDNGKPGKGSWQREAQVDEQTVQRNWCRTFGHQLGCLGAACIDCGTSAAEITASREEVRSN